MLGSCLKKSDNKCSYSQSTIVAPASEQQALLDSLDVYGITATKDPSGFYYNIADAGSSVKVKDLCSTIAINYTGSFFNGQSFGSSSSTVAFVLGGLIDGWKKGIPLIGKGGSIDLYIPPSLAYGANDIKDNQGNVVIPANSYLVFHVDLVDIAD
jgi:FKBP-type peptidyl-prolyl cis-trans isomerase FkpA